MKDKSQVDVGVSRWRDVKKELPKEGILVLTYGKTFQFELHGRDSGKWIESGHYKYITHWMSLPETPSY